MTREQMIDVAVRRVRNRRPRGADWESPHYVAKAYGDAISAEFCRIAAQLSAPILTGCDAAEKLRRLAVARQVMGAA